MNAARDAGEARRLALFIARLLSPPAPAAHQGIARSLLGTTYKWRRGDLDFLRLMVCRSAAGTDDFARLLGLMEQAKSQEAANVADFPAAAADDLRAAGLGLGGQA